MSNMTNTKWTCRSCGSDNATEWDDLSATCKRCGSRMSLNSPAERRTTEAKPYDCCGWPSVAPSGRPAIHGPRCPTFQRTPPPQRPFTHPNPPYGEPGHVCRVCDTANCTQHDDRRCPICGGFESIPSHARCM